MIRDNKLRMAHLDFCNEMAHRLEEKEAQGFTGWNDPKERKVFEDKIRDNLEKFINSKNNKYAFDISNILMFLSRMNDIDAEGRTEA